MRVKCRHGYYLFMPERAGDLLFFAGDTGITLAKGPYGWTLPALAALPLFSIQGQDYGGQPARVNYCGHPWEVMQANGFVYNLEAGALEPVENITDAFTPYLQNTGEAVALSLPQAGSKTQEGKVLVDFEGAFRFYGKKVVIYENQSI